MDSLEGREEMMTGSREYGVGSRERVRRALLAVVLLFVLTACSPEKDPRNQADAFATREEAARETKQKEYDLAQAKIEDDIANAEARTKLEIYQATKERRIQVLSAVIFVLGVIAAGAVGYFLIMSSRISVETARRVGTATADAAELRSKLIYLPKNTRVWPALLERLADGTLLVTNINVDGVTNTAQAKNPDTQMVPIDGAIRYTPAVAEVVAKTKNARAQDVANVGSPIPIFDLQPNGSVTNANSEGGQL